MESDGADRPRERDGGSDQERFDDRVARDMWGGLVVLGGLGVFAALVISIIALAQSNGGHTTTTVIAPATTTTARSAPGRRRAVSGDALGRQIFVSGDPSTGAVACGSCHTMKAAGTHSSIGPNLDKFLSEDPASATLESIVSPNKEIATGYRANIMPKTYGRLTTRQLHALANYIYHSTNTKAKRAARSASP